MFILKLYFVGFCSFLCKASSLSSSLSTIPRWVKHGEMECFIQFFSPKNRFGVSQKKQWQIMDGLWWPLGLIIVLLLLYWMIDITNKSANAYSKQIQIWFQWIHKFGTKLLWKVGVWQTFPKFFFEIEAGLNDLPHGAHLCSYTTDWMINFFLKSTGKLLRCCTSETTQRTWEEIQRINQEKSSCNNFSHLLKTIIQCKH